MTGSAQDCVSRELAGGLASLLIGQSFQYTDDTAAEYWQNFSVLSASQHPFLFAFVHLLLCVMFRATAANTAKLFLPLFPRAGGRAGRACAMRAKRPKLDSGMPVPCWQTEEKALRLLSGRCSVGFFDRFGAHLGQIPIEFSDFEEMTVQASHAVVKLFARELRPGCLPGWLRLVAKSVA